MISAWLVSSSNITDVETQKGKLLLNSGDLRMFPGVVDAGGPKGKTEKVKDQVGKALQELDEQKRSGHPFVWEIMQVWELWKSRMK